MQEEAYECFKTFFTDNMMSQFEYHTEANFRDTHSGDELLVKNQFYSFLLVLLTMCISPRRSISHYWSNNSMISNEHIKTIMSQEKFSNIWKHICFSAEEYKDQSIDKIEQATSLIESVSKQFIDIYNSTVCQLDATENFSLDCNTIQGIQDASLTVLAVSNSKYILSFKIIQKSESPASNVIETFKSITKTFQNPVVFGAQQFSTIDLITGLKQLKVNYIGSVATVQQNVGARGEYIMNDMKQFCIIDYQSAQNKSVRLMATKRHEDVRKNRREKPQVIQQYEDNSNIVKQLYDDAQQIGFVHRCTTLQSIFMQLLKFCVQNAHVLYKLKYEQTDLLDFSILVIKQLLTLSELGQQKMQIQNIKDITVGQHQLLSISDIYPNIVQTSCRECLGPKRNTKRACQCGIIMCHECYIQHIIDVALQKALRDGFI